MKRSLHGEKQIEDIPGKRNCIEEKLRGKKELGVLGNRYKGKCLKLQVCGPTDGEG